MKLNKDYITDQIVRFRSHHALMALSGLLVIGTVAAIGTSLMQGSKAATPGTIYLTPATGTVTAGSTINVVVREESGTTPINVAQSAVSFDPAKLQYISMTPSNAFPTIAARQTTTAGKVMAVSGVAIGSPSITGDQEVVTFTFKVLATTGTAAVNIDNSQSMLLRSSDSVNIFTTGIGATYSVAGGQTPSGNTLTLTPASGSFTQNSTVNVEVHAKSTDLLSVVQSVLTYNPAQLQYVSFSNGTAFPSVSRSNTATAGTLDFIRGIPGGDAGVSGDNVVVTVTFKVLASSGTAGISFGTGSALFRSSDATNVLSGSTGANYTVNAPVAGPSIGTVTLNFGFTTGNQLVTITGANFAAGATVSFGGNPATSVTVVNANTITARTPAKAVGAVAVTVTNPNGLSGTLANAFNYRKAGDSSGDGRVNVLDYSALAAHDGQSYAPADYDGDGTVGVTDLALLLANWTW